MGGIDLRLGRFLPAPRPTLGDSALYMADNAPAATCSSRAGAGGTASERSWSQGDQRGQCISGCMVPPADGAKGTPLLGHTPHAYVHNRCRIHEGEALFVSLRWATVEGSLQFTIRYI